MRSRSEKILIFIVEPSRIITEGLISIIDPSQNIYNFEFAQNLSDFLRYPKIKDHDVVIINPALIMNQEKLFQHRKDELIGVSWVGLIYSLFDSSLLSLFDENIYIDDTPESIQNKIRKLSDTNKKETKCVRETLSVREIDLLKLLVSGNSNKEIANLLNISINTVITHRKNISQKTGIKSASGLAIYAVVNNLIDIESFS